MTMLTISELAAFAGVSARTIRHYHDIGLMPPAGRDSAGRRIYAPSDAVRLARVRSLAEAGFTLTDILEVLPVGVSEVDTGVFTRVRSRVAERLAEEAKVISGQRRHLAGLKSPELVGLSDGNAALFRRWREIGVAEEFIRALGRVWVVYRTVFPDTFDDGVRWATEALESAEYRVLLRDVSHLWTVEPDDPLVVETARRVADYIRRLDEEELRRGEFPASVVIDSVIEDIPPALIRFNELVGQLTGTEVAR